MKTLKLNQLEKSEMNVVRGGEAMNPCSAAYTGQNGGTQVPILFTKLTGLEWKYRYLTW